MHKKNERLNIKNKISESLRKKNLSQSVINATESSQSTRDKRVAEIKDWELFRNITHEIKRNVIDNLAEYLEQFELKCKENSIIIHWARDSKEASDIILNIAKQNNVKNVIKSKSLTSEEIELNKIFAEENIKSIETDLGEFIVQLRGETPTHLIIPAIHINKEEVGELFKEKLDVEYSNDPEKLLKIARKVLRKKFINADMSVTGANFALAENGSICVIENEGNAHLSLTLPKIHVALIGIEKIIPSIEYLPYFLKVLAPSATGQKTSNYVNIVNGPTAKEFGEGPEEVHFILLDNGRSKIAINNKFNETLFCIRCGACLNVCPVYQQIGGNAYDWVYMGPIGITLIPQYLGNAMGKDAPFLSSLCGACKDVCPVKIDLPKHLLNLRNQVALKNSSFFEKYSMQLFKVIAKSPFLFNSLSSIIRIFNNSLGIKIKHLMPGYNSKRRKLSIDKIRSAKSELKKLKKMESING